MEWQEKYREMIWVIDSFVLGMQPFQRGLFFFRKRLMLTPYWWFPPDKFVHYYVTYIDSWGVNVICVETKRNERLQLQVSWTMTGQQWTCFKMYLIAFPQISFSNK